jgi:hypothetical protein
MYRKKSKGLMESNHFFKVVIKLSHFFSLTKHSKVAAVGPLSPSDIDGHESALSSTTCHLVSLWAFLDLELGRMTGKLEISPKSHLTGSASVKASVDRLGNWLFRCSHSSKCKLA